MKNCWKLNQSSGPLNERFGRTEAIGFTLWITLSEALLSAQRGRSKMKKLLLGLAIALTACNLTIGIGYAATCKSTTGARACGTTCLAKADGSCACEGTCTAEERDWVGSKADDEEMLEE